MSDIPPKVEVILRRSDYEQMLLDKLRGSREDVNSLFLEIQSLRSQLREAEQKLYFELHANQELIDILRSHNIPFRSALDRAKRRVK